MTYEPVPNDELEAIISDPMVMIPKEALAASQRYLAGKLLEAQNALLAKDE